MRLTSFLFCSFLLLVHMYVRRSVFFFFFCDRSRKEDMTKPILSLCTHTLTQLLLVEFVVMWLGDSHTFCFISNSLSKKKKKHRHGRYQVFFPPHGTRRARLEDGGRFLRFSKKNPTYARATLDALRMYVGLLTAANSPHNFIATREEEPDHMFFFSGLCESMFRMLQVFFFGSVSVQGWWRQCIHPVENLRCHYL